MNARLKRAAVGGRQLVLGEAVHVSVTMHGHGFDCYVAAIHNPEAGAVPGLCFQCRTDPNDM